METPSTWHVWLRLNLAGKYLEVLEQDFPTVKFLHENDESMQPEDITVVLTDNPLPDDLVEKMHALQWLHVTRGGSLSFPFRDHC